MGSSGRIIKAYTDLDHASYMAEVARGNVSGSRLMSGYGRRTSAGAEDNAPLWPNGAMTLLPDVGAQLTIVSDSIEDGAGTSTGALSLELHYLDGNLDPRSEIITLTGTTPVLTDATDIRFVQCMHIANVGSVGYAVGEITAKLTTVVHSIIDAGGLRCTSAFRMVPKGKRIMIAAAAAGAVSGTAAAGVTITIVANELDVHIYKDPLILVPHAGIAVQDTSTALAFPLPIPFSEGAIVGMTVTTDKAAVSTGTWFGWTEDV